MTRAILTCFHKYQPYGGEYYKPILDFYLYSMNKYKNEYNQLYLVDSNWNIPESPDYKVLKVNPNFRYYDAYKLVLPHIKEDLVLFLDDDMMVYKQDVINKTFTILESDAGAINELPFDVVSIYDTIGTKHFEELNGKSKFCLYWFAARKKLLIKYLNVDWGQAPWGETLSYLTEAMLKDGLKPYEWEEDKSSIYFDGNKDGEKSKDLGYYHIRAGSVPALLLAYRKHDPKQYWEYLKNSPKNEYLRQCSWYSYMGGNCESITYDLEIPYREFYVEYLNKFKKYHGL